MTSPALLCVRDLSVSFGAGRRASDVVHGVTFVVRHGAVLGLVGGSGSGKSTIAKAIVGVVPMRAGRIDYQGTDLARLTARQRRAALRRIQLIPQNPDASLDPRRTVGESIAEAIDPLRAHARRHRDTIATWLDRVRLDADLIDRYPHELSGGQRQRVAITRALVVEPDLVIADEITSSLDVSVQAEMLDLLAELRAELQLTVLFISHNLAVIQQVCDEVVVLHEGRIVETAPAAQLFAHPRHPYTQRLLDSVPGAPGFRLD